MNWVYDLVTNSFLITGIFIMDDCSDYQSD